MTPSILLHWKQVKKVSSFLLVSIMKDLRCHGVACLHENSIYERLVYESLLVEASLGHVR